MAAGDIIKDANGVSWRETQGGNYRAEDGPNKGKLYKDVVGPGAPTAAPTAPPAPTGPLAANGEQINSSTLQATAVSLQDQVNRRIITPEAAKAELRRQVLQMGANSLQGQVSRGEITQEQANAQYANLSNADPMQLIAQHVNTVPIQSLYEQMNAVAGTKTKGTTLGDVREINAAQVGPTERMQGAQITPVVQVQAPQMGQAQTFQGPQIGPVAQGVAGQTGPAAQMAGATVAPAAQVGVGDSVFYDKQAALAAALEQQAAGQGPSLAGLQLQQALEAALRSNMGALSAQPGVSQGLAARLFGYQAGNAQNEAAMAAAQARMAEQLSARQQLQTLYQAGRGQDVAVQQGNQVATNQVAAQQAQLEAAKQAANMQAQNEIAQAQAQLDSAMAQFNAGQINQQQLEQAQINYNTSVANANAVNQRAVEQADLEMRGLLANQLAANTQAYNQAQLVQEANKFNADTSFKTGVQNATFQQDAAQSNQAAFNQRNIAQGQISGGITQASLGASATLGAAEAAADAARDVAETNQETAIVTNTQDNLPDESVVEAPTEESDDDNPTTTGGGGSGGSSGGSASGVIGGRAQSDKKAKKNIKAGDAAADDMMSKLAAAIYEYKNPVDGTGPQVGVMAQDLEKSQLGKQMVEKGKRGRSINFAKGLGAVLAAQASLHQRMKALEGGK